MESFDLVVVGSGPGGSRAAIQAAKLGRRVALVERGGLGGFCVHTGTIPSKTLREAAFRGLAFAAATKRMRQVRDAEAQVVEDQLRRNGVKLFRAEAAFSGPHELVLRGSRTVKVRAEKILLATGTSPIRHEEIPWATRGVYDSDTILGLRQLPKRLLVIGAGVIGAEYASIFAHLGSQVTLADRRQELLRAVDQEITDALRASLAAAGLRFALGLPFAFLPRAKGSANLKIKLGSRTQAFDAALVCLGRQSGLSSMNLAAAGLAADERGNLKVNDSFATSIPHIYAVGDVIGAPGLAAAAAEQGRIAACRMFGASCASFPGTFPYGIYTIPEISMVGKREEELAGIPFVVGRAHFRELARGLISGDEHGFVKLLVHRETRRLLGVHVFGTAASDLVHIGQAVMALDAPVDYLVDQVFNYPTFAEAYKVAALQVTNQLPR